MRGRKPLNKVRMTLYLTEGTARRLDLMLLDPLRKHPHHGLRNEVIERLLEAWLARGGSLEELGLI